MNASITPLIAEPWTDYALLDSGAGRKLERYGKIIVDRPEPQALWSKSLPESRWAVAHAVFTDSGTEDSETGKWQINRDHTPESWDVVWKDITVINDANGKPSCSVKGLKRGRVIHISISHSKNYAVANAIVATK